MKVLMSMFKSLEHLKRPKESGKGGIQATILEYLGTLEAMGKLLVIRNQTGALKAGRGHESSYEQRYIKFGRKGSADILVWLPGGQGIMFEVKREGEKQTREQKVFQAKCDKLRIPYYVVRSVASVKLILDRSHHGTPPGLEKHHA